ncbi:helix-turn-helix transcriptional regulator [Klenkia brasiliensis]|uniref:Helix-turn-helix domain-containing protein n=1 Tax=Klenkia brasiliensis TaxID=333142 RepID=A0A1G7SIC1_9ACTN|nr:helix-turn-helix transcriptional regulator [Klenkia brasiliensis]SDG22169.1 Helix-turn-helix domain-containing protein [Klenkia brasiliensis]
MRAVVHRTSFVSRDEDEVTGFIGRVYAEHRSRFAPVTRGATFSALTHDALVDDAPAVGADRLRTSIDYTGTSEAGFTDYVFFVVHAGSVQMGNAGAVTTAVSGDTAFYPLHVAVDFDMQHYDVTTLRLPAHRLDQVAEEAAGVPLGGLRFHDVVPVSAAAKRRWRSLVELVSGALADRHGPPTSPLLAEEMARTAAVAALHTFPNTALTRQHVPGAGQVAPAAVRRAVAHIEAHADRPLTLTGIAEAAGTGARALQQGFRRHLGTTPLGYLRRVRLERAHRDLQQADPAGPDGVAGIAARWGFRDPGRFATAYRAAYGRSPAATLLD